MVEACFLGEVVFYLRIHGYDATADELENSYIGHLGDVVEVEHTGNGLIVHGVEPADDAQLIEPRGRRAIYIE